MADYKYQMNSLGSKYPIVAMAMNQVSDINLALAVRRSGAIPSLSIFNYKNNFRGLVTDLLNYKNEFNDFKLVLSLGDRELKIPAIMDLILKFKIEFIELIIDNNFDIQQELLMLSNNTKVFVKCLSANDVIDGIDGVILKGNEGAGQGQCPTETLFTNIQSQFPHLLIIVSGGISTADQVKYYIDRGAVAVGVGTIISACQESKISMATKQRMIDSSISSLTRFSDRASQQALVFTEYSDDDSNHTGSLAAGINDPTTGHVFAGTAIDSITEILPVDTIIKSLVAKL